MYGDDQAKICSFINTSLHENWGGEWAIIVCPKDQKTYNVCINSVRSNTGEPICFNFIR